MHSSFRARFLSAYVALGLSALPVNAQRAVALAGGGSSLLSFELGAPGTALNTVAISRLGAGGSRSSAWTTVR